MKRMKNILSLALILVCSMSLKIFAIDSIPCDLKIKHSNISESRFSKIEGCLLKACKLAEAIQNTDTRQCILAELESYKKTLQIESLRNPNSMYYTAECFYENIEEILSECSDTSLKNEIQKCIKDTLLQLYPGDESQ